MSDGPARPVLCIVHHNRWDVSLVGEHFARRGVAVDIRQPNAGDPLPDPDEAAGAVVFGGTMSANDDHDPAIRAELRFVEAALAAGTPLFGVCLGGQMLARALGARVAPHATGLWEIGYRPVAPTAAGAAVFEGVGAFFQWHGEGFDLPAGAERLAGGDLYPEQAFRYGANAYGVQFHPEISRPHLDLWQALDMDRPGADPLDRQNADDARLRPAVEAWLGRFLDGWLTAG
jgi:GMP synthase (glutamine-hydrolysing)